MVIGCDDPSEKAIGRGPGILRDEGVEVELRRRRRGGRRPPARAAVPQARAHRPAAGHAEVGRQPRRLHRDARAATRAGSPGPESRALVHRWRAESDAVAVGIGTALADDPLLTARDLDDPGAAPADPGRLRLCGAAAARLGAGRLDRRGAAGRHRRARTRIPPGSRRCASAGAEVVELGRRPRAPARRRARRARPPRDHLAAGRGRRRARRVAARRGRGRRARGLRRADRARRRAAARRRRRAASGSPTRPSRSRSSGSEAATTCCASARLREW